MSAALTAAAAGALRANPWSRGTGAALASAFGASTNLANKGFYGHLYPTGVRTVSPVDFITFALYHSAESVMMDSAGARFADESRGDHNNAMALAERGCRAALLWSGEVQQRAVAAPFVPEVRSWTGGRSPGTGVGGSPPARP